MSLTLTALRAMAERVAPLVYARLDPGDPATFDDVREGLIASVGGPGDGQTELLLVVLCDKLDEIERQPRTPGVVDARGAHFGTGNVYNGGPR
jgi:hypothetical protein